MNQEEHDYQKLRSYLLAELSGEEEERFDELSITDERFDAALKTMENDLLDAYASGKMDAATRKKFESVYLSSPLRREKLAFAGALQNFTGKQSASIHTLPYNESAEKTSWLSLLNPFKNQNTLLQWGFAAALAVLFVGVLWFLNVNRQKTEIAQQPAPPAPQATLPAPAATSNNAPAEPTAIPGNSNNNSSQTGTEKKPNINRNAVEVKPSPEKPEVPAPKPVIASFILAPPLRGAGNLPALSVPSNATRVSIELQLEANDYDGYQVALVKETGGGNLWRANALKAFGAGQNKTLRVNFPAKLLNSGIFLLTVSGINKSGVSENIATYSFRCVIK